MMSRIRLMRWVIGFAVSVGLVLLAIFILPPVTASHEHARAMQCRNNLKEIVLALYYYHDEYRTFPPVFVADARKW